MSVGVETSIGHLTGPSAPDWNANPHGLFNACFQEGNLLQLNNIRLFIERVGEVAQQLCLEIAPQVGLLVEVVNGCGKNESSCPRACKPTMISNDLIDMV